MENTTTQNPAAMTAQEMPRRKPTRQERADSLTGKINQALADIQSLAIQPTEHNCILIADAIAAMKAVAEIYGEVEKEFSILEAQLREAVERNIESKGKTADGSGDAAGAAAATDGPAAADDPEDIFGEKAMEAGGVAEQA